MKEKQANRWELKVYDRVFRGPGQGILSRIVFQIAERWYRRIVRRGDPLLVRNVAGLPLSMPFSHQWVFHLKHFPHYGWNLARLAALVAEHSSDFALIDVGANIGDTVAQVKQATHARILCIEGDDFFFDLLKKNLSQVPGVEFAHAFVGPADGTHWNVHRENGTASLLRSARGGAHPQTLQQLLLEHPTFAQARMLKIDTDGFDGHVLRSAAAFLNACHPVLFFEYVPDLMQKAGDDAAALRDFLKGLGYDSVLIYNNFGEFQGSASLLDRRRWEEVDAYLAGREAQLYADLAVFHRADQALFEAARSRELRLGRSVGIPQREAA